MVRVKKLCAQRPSSPISNGTGSIGYCNDRFPSELQSRRNIELVHEAPGKAPTSQFLILVNC